MSIVARRGLAGSGFKLGYTKPGGDNTGYAPGTVFTDYTTDQYIETDGVTFTNCRFTCKVKVRAKNVTFINCHFRGEDKPGQVTDPCVRCHESPADNTRFINCEVGWDGQHGWPDTGILGASFTAERCNIHHTVDGIRTVYTDGSSKVDPPAGSGVNIMGCYVHNLIYISPTAQHSDNQSHNDCIQITEGANTNIVGNFLWAYVDPAVGNAQDPGVPIQQPAVGPQYAWMTGVIVTPDHGVVSDLLIDRNWINGGEFEINVSEKSYGAIQGLAITNNHIGGDDRRGGYDILVASATRSIATFAGNTFPDGSPVPISNGG